MAETVADLVNDTPVKGLSGAAGDETFFKIEVPAGQASLEFAVSGGTGDVDLYVRKGSRPTKTGYDYRPALKGNDEKVEITDPAAATWYVMLLGQQAYSGVTLQAKYVSMQDKITPLVNGVPVKGLAGIAVTQRFFSIEVPAGQDLPDHRDYQRDGKRRSLRPQGREADDSPRMTIVLTSRATRRRLRSPIPKPPRGSSCCGLSRPMPRLR